MPIGFRRHTRRQAHRAVLLTAAAGLVLGGVAAGPAQAAPAGPAPAVPAPVAAPKVATPEVTAGLVAERSGLSREQTKQRLAAEAKRIALADRLTRQLGARSGGAYFERGGGLVVAVTDAKAGAAVTRAGAKARLVKHSAAKLNGIKAAFDRAGKGVVGSTWAVDTAANKVVVTVPSTAPKAAANALAATAAAYRDAVRLTTTKRTVATAAWVAGGTAIWHSSGGRCSAGFNVWNGATRFVLTAGHCTALGGTWSNWDGTYLGPSVGTYFPGQDHGLVRIDGPVTQLNGVYLYNGYYQPLTWAAYAYAGQYACKSGSTTGYTCGYVTATNVTINYAQGPVYGAIQGNICVQPGDSGGALHSGGTALGIVSGYQPGTCVGFFQQVVPALNYWGVGLI
jgi:streptogrisin D